ncbi:MAG: hypothetical protein HY360_17905, partial [Verrucomicrobia bacterium]|nr:hypothetical protein [Verrucomicrobiota bacterium]
MNVRRWTGTSGWIVVECLAVLFSAGICFGDKKEPDVVLPGGPLEGLKLPLYKTQHGEAPGKPGAIPDKFRFIDPPFEELFPGSVEHFRAYMTKYLPIRPMLDKQSLLRNWKAPELAKIANAATEDYAEPVYLASKAGESSFTGCSNAPVKVIRCKARAPIFKLDLGELPIGMYCLKTVGAVETKNLQRARKALYYTVKLNDGPNGETNVYRQRIGYVDDFYSVSEVYFHATGKRRFIAELFADKDSLVDLLAHNVELHDVLVGSEKRPIKKRMTLMTPFERKQLRGSGMPPEQYAMWYRKPPDRSPAERLQRDAELWNGYPHVNYQSADGDTGYPVQERLIGAAGKSRKEVEEQYGTWATPRQSTEHISEKPSVLMENAKLGLVYTLQDAAQQKPLPDPYPFKDDGAGLQFPPVTPDAPPQNWLPIGEKMHACVYQYLQMTGRACEFYQHYGDKEHAHDGAIMLIRFAYDLPSSDSARMLSQVCEQPARYERDARNRHRFTETPHLEFHSIQEKYVRLYDKVFDYIQGNETLAASVSRFVPWVKTSSDVIQLLDVYLVQHYVKRVLRYQWYGHDTGSILIVPAATVIDDRSLSDPWMNWLFTRAFVYPLPLSGLQDILTTGYDREGCKYIASAAYAQVEAACYTAAYLNEYLRAGGDSMYDLSNPERYPKPLDSCHWQYRITVAGHDRLRIGDVCGPDKMPGHHNLEDRLSDKSRLGWQWSKDPVFAFFLKHCNKRANETDEEWNAIEKAASAVKRAPFLDLKSRVNANWAGILETGLQHDDFRFRRAAYLRIGQGWGHQHNDSLDLQVVAHGIPMTVDGGQRPGYSIPPDRNTRLHNLLEVDCFENMFGHSWVNALSDASGARYTRATLMPPKGLEQVRHYSRQMALLDVDEGEGSKPLLPAATLKDVALDPVSKTANSYVFDVVRVSGGTLHTYCFHGAINDPDGAQPKTNLPKILSLSQPAGGDLSEKAAKYLAEFCNEKYCGQAPETLETVIPIYKERLQPKQDIGTEKYFLGGHFDPKSPDKFLKWRVFG